MVAVSGLQKTALSMASASEFSSGLGLVGKIGLFAIFLSSSSSAIALPLSITSFNGLASECAAGGEIPALRAVARIESHFDPSAVRDNTTHESWTSMSSRSAISLAKQRISEGHSVDIGLMQINSVNLKPLGISVVEAFDACKSLAAAHHLLLAAFAAGSSETERQAALLISFSRYNTGRPLAGILNGYADKVVAAQATLLTPEDGQPQLTNKRWDWDVWGAMGARRISWIVTADGSTEIGRAGARISDTRFEGRAPAIASKKGEPYEVSAYQESEASQH